MIRPPGVRLRLRREDGSPLDSAAVRAGNQLAGGVQRVVVGGAVHVFRDARIARQARDGGQPEAAVSCLGELCGITAAGSRATLLRSKASGI